MGQLVVLRMSEKQDIQGAAQAYGFPLPLPVLITLLTIAHALSCPPLHFLPGSSGDVLIQSGR